MSPVRKVSNRGGNIIGKFPSVKLGRLVAFESTIELDFLHFLDQNPNISSFVEQPLTIEYQYGGKKLHYTPDFQVLQGDTHLLVECKPDERVADEENQIKFRAAEAFCQEKDWQFKIVTDRELRGGHALHNLKIMRRYAFHSIPQPLIGSIYAALFASPIPLTIGDVKETVAEQPGLVVAALMWMAYRNQVTIPIEAAPISDATSVYLPNQEN